MNKILSDIGYLEIATAIFCLLLIIFGPVIGFILVAKQHNTLKPRFYNKNKN